MADPDAPNHGVDIGGCSFCGKPTSQVKKLVAGPQVAICNECVDLCIAIIGEDMDDTNVDDVIGKARLAVATLRKRLFEVEADVRAVEELVRVLDTERRWFLRRIGVADAGELPTRTPDG